LFGSAVGLSEDGNTLVVGAMGESSNATAVNGDQLSDSALNSGAAYVFSRLGSTWIQQAYIKASNTRASDLFGEAISLSGDGDTLAVAAEGENSGATGVNGNQLDDSMLNSGAVYVFNRTGGAWGQQAYVKASNTGVSDFFGATVSLSGDGNTLAVAAPTEDSNATGVNGDQLNDSLPNSGAVYVFSRIDAAWSQQAYIKASNTGGPAAGEVNGDNFGVAISVSADGDTLAVGAVFEDSAAVGVNREQLDNTAASSGAVYVFRRGDGNWDQQAYVKASNTRANDVFGNAVSLSGGGNTLAVGARGEDSGGAGIDGDQADNSAGSAGAVYVFAHIRGAWSQQAYVKASNTDVLDEFGSSVGLSADGDTLAVGANREASNAVGFNANQADNSAPTAGALYLY
ncbi:MAG: FG-GAP repeat protein, partial [Gammaproteobacteria bacterium]